MSTQRVIRDISKFIESMGFSINEVHRKRHYKFRLTRPEWGGKTKLLVVSSSFSDWRALKNIEGDLKRMLDNRC